MHSRGGTVLPRLLVETLRGLQTRIAALDAQITARAKRDDVAQRLMSIPGIGPLIATAIEALAPPGKRSDRGATSPLGSD